MNLKQNKCTEAELVYEIRYLSESSVTAQARNNSLQENLEAVFID